MGAANGMLSARYWQTRRLAPDFGFFTWQRYHTVSLLPKSRGQQTLEAGSELLPKAACVCGAGQAQRLSVADARGMGR